jgi:hypothetical protein
VQEADRADDDVDREADYDQHLDHEHIDFDEHHVDIDVDNGAADDHHARRDLIR